MDRSLLRKVQLAQLKIAKEVRRVCDENGISYFLCCGTLLGAIRHQGFIPWDDDLDMGMLRQDYEKFCRIAPEKLRPGFCLQSWYTEDGYALPFAKVRMKNTLYVESKGRRLQENGFYIDVFPFDYAPVTEEQQYTHGRKLADLFRMKLMKSGWKPWMDNDRIQWKKRIGYLYYQMRAALMSQQKIVRRYDSLAVSIPATDILCRQRGMYKLDCYRVEWYEELAEYIFEGEPFKGPKQFDAVLTAQFGDYMQLPPEDQRENRHQIIAVDFGDGKTRWEK